MAANGKLRAQVFTMRTGSKYTCTIRALRMRYPVLTVVDQRSRPGCAFCRPHGREYCLVVFTVRVTLRGCSHAYPHLVVMRYRIGLLMPSHHPSHLIVNAGL